MYKTFEELFYYYYNIEFEIYDDVIIIVNAIILFYICIEIRWLSMKKEVHRYPDHKARRAYKLHRRNLHTKEKRRLRRIAICGKTKEQKKELYQKRQMNEAFRSFEKIKAPTNFSMASNTEETLQFIARLEACYAKRKKVFINLESVTNIGNGAIVVLLSKMVQFKSSNIDFNGNFPKNKQCAFIIKESGFFKNLYKDFAVEDEYIIGDEGNKIYTHGQKNVNPVLSSEIISHISTLIWGMPQRCLGVQRVFLELMQNTNNHASFGHFGEKHWWLSVNYDKINNITRFSFVDFGVGIFKSLENKNTGSKFYGIIEKVKNKFKYGNNAELLKLLLEGEIHKTATGDYYRGKGLPGIVNAYNKNQISNLMIISNNAKANLKDNQYNCLTNTLNGSFFSWEVNHKSEHFA